MHLLREGGHRILAHRDVELDALGRSPVRSSAVHHGFLQRPRVQWRKLVLVIPPASKRVGDRHVIASQACEGKEHAVHQHASLAYQGLMSGIASLFLKAGILGNHAHGCSWLDSIWDESKAIAVGWTSTARVRLRDKWH